jgi:hypothetical protein
MELECTAVHKPKDIEAWFYQYRDVIIEHAVMPMDIYNFNKSGFRVGISKDQWIIIREPY